MSGPYRSSYLQYNFKLYIQSRCSLQNKNTAQFFKWARDLNMHLPKTVTQMEDKCMRRCSTSFIIQFSHSVLSDSLWPHKPQHTRPPCSSPTPGVHSDSRPLSQWCLPAISSSVLPFSSWPQSLPASEFFSMSQLFAWGGQSTGVSALASFFQRNPRTDILQKGLVGSPCSPRDSQESSPTQQFNSLALSFLYSPTLTSIHDHWKNHSLD